VLKVQSVAGKLLVWVAPEFAGSRADIVSEVEEAGEDLHGGYLRHSSSVGFSGVVGSDGLVTQDAPVADGPSPPVQPSCQADPAARALLGVPAGAVLSSASIADFLAAAQVKARLAHMARMKAATAGIDPEGSRQAATAELLEVWKGLGYAADVLRAGCKVDETEAVSALWRLLPGGLVFPRPPPAGWGKLVVTVFALGGLPCAPAPTTFALPPAADAFVPTDVRQAPAPTLP
jgi:hypothetical protein